jgi:hypothetical protein
MPSARDAREWAANGGLHGIGDSLYTPFSGRDGDGIDFDAYRALVRYCVGDLGHAMLWLTSGLAEWWSLTLPERKQLVEVAIEEARGRPDYFTHWGEAVRDAASVIGLPTGDYPHSRPPQAILPEEAKLEIKHAFENAGLAGRRAEV